MRPDAPADRIAIVRAAILRSIPAEQLDLAEADDPMPAAGEAVLEVEACGICGTDLHILEGASYRPAVPFVLGHEPVGVVAEVGPGVDRAWLGRRATITLFVGEGSCPYCAAGDERLCSDLVGISGVLALPGGFAERMLVRERQLVELPTGLAADAAATLVDGGATATNAVRVAETLVARAPAPVRSGLTVIVGAGPIGHIVAELRRDAGRPAVLVQPSPLRREAAAALGHDVVESLDDLDEAPSVVIDCAGAPEALRWALDRLRPRGVFVAAGYAPVPSVDLATAARKELTITGVRSGDRADLLRILTLAADGRIRTPSVDTWPLADINSAIRALREHRVAGKAVIVPTA